ncbi:MAG: pilus assembly protein PilP [Bdellovibrionota bacterium]
MKALLVALTLLSGCTALAAQSSPIDEPPKIRDPFKRPNTASKDEVPKTELELFPLEQFKMIGVMTGPMRVRVMLLAPNGKTYFASENTKIGVRKGVVQKITTTSMKVREKTINVLGQEENVDTEVKLSSGKKDEAPAAGNPALGGGG